MANSLRAWIKQMRYTGKTTPKRAERIIDALDLADKVKDEAFISSNFCDYCSGRDKCEVRHPIVECDSFVGRKVIFVEDN